MGAARRLSEEVEPVGDDLGAVAGVAVAVFPARIVQIARNGDDVALLARGRRLALAVEAGDLVELGGLGRVAGRLVDIGLAVLELDPVGRDDEGDGAIARGVCGSLATRPVRLTSFMMSLLGLPAFLPAGDTDWRRGAGTCTDARSAGGEPLEGAGAGRRAAATRAPGTGLPGPVPSPQVSRQRAEGTLAALAGDERTIVRSPSRIGSPCGNGPGTRRGGRGSCAGRPAGRGAGRATNGAPTGSPGIRCGPGAPATLREAGGPRPPGLSAWAGAPHRRPCAVRVGRWTPPRCRAQPRRRGSRCAPRRA